MRARSIRWTLIVWQGLVLALVIGVFGATLYLRVRTGLLARVDATLESRASALAAALERDVFAGWELELDDRYLKLLGESGWFEATTAEGRSIRRGGPLPDAPAIPSLGISERGDARELVLAGPRDTRVRVGQSIAAERAELAQLLTFMIVAGVTVLVLATWGGSWLATRTLRPIERMSAAAARVSERDLGQRMDESEAPTELRDLARTLNATFGRLEAAFARQARFTADASHELRTPLSVVRAQAELALRRERPESEYREALEACLRSATRMSRVVEQLLALARADTGEVVIARGDVELETIVRDALEEARGDAASARIELRSSLTTSVVRGDATLLHEVVANLVSNAIRYNHAGGHVEVTLEHEGSEVALSVRDDGQGIPDEALSHVFERFFRVDAARSREHGGSGLGLSITRWIVEAHGGSVTATSRVGAGSTFRVTLPLARVNRPPDTAPSGNRPSR